MITIAQESLYGAVCLPEDGEAVLIRDNGHLGTVLTNVQDTYYFASLEDGRVYRRKRLLVWLDLAEDWEAHAPCVYACDLDGPSGLVVAGVDDDDEPPAVGVLVWDSAEAA